MDVYISEEYVTKRRAERRAAREAAAAAARGGGHEEKATARAAGGEMKRWTGAWAEMSKRRIVGSGGDGINASTGAGGSVEDVVFSYFSA
jgi:hypothetical protein